MNAYDPYSFDFERPEMPAATVGSRDVAIAITESGDLLAQPRSPRAVAWFAALNEPPVQPGLYCFPAARMPMIGPLLDREGFTCAPLVVARLVPLDISLASDAKIVGQGEPPRSFLQTAWGLLTGTAHRSASHWRPLQGSNLQPAD